MSELKPIRGLTPLPPAHKGTRREDEPSAPADDDTKQSDEPSEPSEPSGGKDGHTLDEYA